MPNGSIFFFFNIHLLILNSARYHSILVHHAVPGGLKLLGKNFVFQEDNAPVHTAKANRKYLESKAALGILRTMYWPPQSPDLNPIEQIWELLKSMVNKNSRSSKDTLWRSVQEVWQKISPSVLKKYIDTMPKRLLAVIEASGGHTKY